MAYIHPPAFGDELRRTLGFFSGGAAPGPDADVDPDVDPAEEAPAVRPTPTDGRRRHGKDAFFSMSADAELLLEPVAIDLLALRLQVDASALLQVSRIPARTFHRRQAEGRSLSGTETDRVLRIARVASLAERVFEDAGKARRWLSKDHRLLGAKPLDLLASDQGTHEVEAELQRIEWGDFA